MSTEGWSYELGRYVCGYCGKTWDYIGGNIKVQSVRLTCPDCMNKQLSERDENARGEASGRL